MKPTTQTPPKMNPVSPPKGEKLVPLHSAVKGLAERFETAPHPATFVRWVTRGVYVGNRRVRLEGLRIGGRWHTTLESVARFSNLTAKVPEIRSQAKRGRTVDRLEPALVQRGA